MTETSCNLQELAVYTDGACSPNPGPGGWGAVILAGGRVVRELSGFGGVSTNNRMELTAAVAALQAVETRHRIVLTTDSQYLRHGITQWIESWRRNGWLTADRKPVKNVDLWQELLRLSELHEINWRWVRGHGTDRWNNRADELAVAARCSGTKQETVAAVAKTSLEDRVHLYPGVTCRASAGVGGWAVVLRWRDRIRVLGGGETGLTANQLYLHAANEGLRALRGDLPVQIHTHSGYLHDGLQSWLPRWLHHDWRTRDGRPVSNRELWQQLAEQTAKRRVQVRLVDRADEPCALQEAKELAREYEPTVG